MNIILFSHDSYAYKLKIIFPFAFDLNGAIFRGQSDAAQRGAEDEVWR